METANAWASDLIPWLFGIAAGFLLGARVVWRPAYNRGWRDCKRWMAFPSFARVAVRLKEHAARKGE